MPFNTGLYVYIVLAIAALVWAIYETYTARSEMRMAVSFILGMSIIGVPFLRSNVLVGLLLIGGHGGLLRLQEAEGFAPAAEHHHRHGHGDADRLLLVCGHRHPLGSQPAHGPEFARQRIRAQVLPQPRAIRRHAAALRRGVQRPGKVPRGGQQLHPDGKEGRTVLRTEAQDLARRKGRIHHHGL